MVLSCPARCPLPFVFYFTIFLGGAQQSVASGVNAGPSLLELSDCWFSPVWLRMYHDCLTSAVNALSLKIFQGLLLAWLLFVVTKMHRYYCSLGAGDSVFIVSGKRSKHLNSKLSRRFHRELIPLT